MTCALADAYFTIIQLIFNLQTPRLTSSFFAYYTCPYNTPARDGNEHHHSSPLSQLTCVKLCGIDLRRIRASCTVKSLFGSVLLSLLHFDASTSPSPIAACHTSTINIYCIPFPCQVAHTSPSFPPCAFLSLQGYGLSSPFSSRTSNFELTAWTNYIRFSSICIKASLQLLWKAPLSLPLQSLLFSTLIHLLSLFFQFDRFPSVQHNKATTRPFQCLDYPTPLLL